MVAASNASRAVNAMKALAGTDWGQNTETLLVTFKALVRPRLEYAAPVWSTVASETSVKRLQTIQNAALRVATGNHLMASQSHLHEETQVLPVKAHTTIACNTTSLSLPPSRTPRSETPRETSSPRKMKPTLVSAHAPRLEHLLEGVDLPLPTKEYRRLLKTVHTETVATTTQSYPPSGVLGTRPPQRRRPYPDVLGGPSANFGPATVNTCCRTGPDSNQTESPPVPSAIQPPTRLPTCSSAPQSPLTSPSLPFGQTRWKPPVSLTWPGYTPQCRAPARGNYNNNNQI